MTRHRPFMPRSFLRRLFFSLTLFVLLCLLFEGAMRWNYRHQGWPSLFRTDPLLGWENRPGWRGIYSGQPVVINNVGCRQPEDVGIKEPGERRLLVLGDSVAFGFGVPQEVTFCARLGTSVLNAGVNGYDTSHEARWLKYRGLALDPDEVLVTVILNDVAPMPLQGEFNMLGIRNRNASQLLEVLVERSAMAYWLQRRLMPKRLDQETFGKYIDLGRQKDSLLRGVPYVTHHLSEIAALCRQYGIRLKTLVIPGRDQLTSPEEDLGFQRELAAWCETRGIDHYDVTPMFLAQEDPVSLYIPQDDAHLSARGHEIVANFLVRIFR